MSHLLEISTVYQFRAFLEAYIKYKLDRGENVSPEIYELLNFCKSVLK